MIRFVAWFVLIGGLAAGVAWFAERPGGLTISWLGYEVETTFMAGIAAVLLSTAALIAVWSLLRAALGAPGAISGFFRVRRQRRGYAALSKGMIAVGSGDARAAQRHAGEAARMISGEPLAQLLKAQAAQMKGDRRAATRVFEAMLQSRETEVLGLRGLFIQAGREGEDEAARAYAAKALRINPALAWAGGAVFTAQARLGAWAEAELTLEGNRAHRLIGKAESDEKRACLMTAQAIEQEHRDPDHALTLALAAHKLQPGLVPAAVIAGRLLADQDDIRKGGKVLEKTWKLNPHPDIAEVYGALRHGDAPRDRLKRVRALVKKGGDGEEAALALARAAIDAHDWDGARKALQPLIDDAPAMRVCSAMAEIEEGDGGDRGRAREWLARALRAPRDPAWVADGFVSPVWLPASPLSGEVGVFEWKVPPGAPPLITARASEDAHDDDTDTADDALMLDGEQADETDGDEAELAALIEAGQELATQVSEAPRGKAPAKDTPAPGDDASTVPDTVKPKTAKPDMAKPDLAKRDMAKPDAEKPEKTEPGNPAKPTGAAAANKQDGKAAKPADAAGKSTGKPATNSAGASSGAGPETGGDGTPAEDGTPAGDDKSGAVFVSPRAPDDPGPEPDDPGPEPDPDATGAKRWLETLFPR